MFQKAKLLGSGSTIRIVAPAKAIEERFIEDATQILINSGFHVEVSEHCRGSYHYFSGTVSERLADLQAAIDDETVDAILCARGGYGSVQLVDKLDWTKFKANPKWIIGFSDITVFHMRLACMQIASIHGTMPLNFSENTPEALQGLFASLAKGKQEEIVTEPHNCNILGSAEGILLGGNASIVYSLLGTNEQPDFKDTVLFLEDLAEQIYHIDRIFYALRKAGVLKQIKGLIIGGMTDMKDTMIPYGLTLEEVIREHMMEYNIPTCFSFPAGHINDNRALLFGDRVRLTVTENGCSLQSV